jgi:lipopolysaccharide/colanic/teichoic acid biosynthesis glycosyltransferase
MSQWKREKRTVIDRLLDIHFSGISHVTSPVMMVVICILACI